MRDNKFKIDGFEFSEDTPVSSQSWSSGVARNHEGPARCTLQSPKTERGRWAQRSLVSCLLGSLLLGLALLMAPAKSSGSVSIFVSFGPPAIPVYVQPPCPGPGLIWTPGYWAWDPDFGYFWVPGTWVLAPFVGALWTPGYWGWYDGGYAWYPGYWGMAVGFYGGIDYGYGYTGSGYNGGYWQGGSFFYNREVNRITNVNIVNVYSQKVVVNERSPRISYNGGPGGIAARPNSAELAAERGRRSGAISQQLEQEQIARSEPAQRARENHGRPKIAATARPGDFRGSGVVRATRAGAPYKEPSRALRGGREGGRSAPPPVERAPGRNAPQHAQPYGRMERPSPGQQRNEQPLYRNNSHGKVQRGQSQDRPPEAQQSHGRAGQERPANPPRREKHGKENDQGPGHFR